MHQCESSNNRSPTFDTESVNNKYKKNPFVCIHFTISRNKFTISQIAWHLQLFVRRRTTYFLRYRQLKRLFIPYLTYPTINLILIQWGWHTIAVFKNFENPLEIYINNTLLLDNENSNNNSLLFHINSDVIFFTIKTLATKSVIFLKSI